MRRILPFFSFAAISLISQGLVFLFNLIVANKLSIADFGLYSILISIVNLLCTLTCQWNSSMMQFCGSKEIVKTGNQVQTNQTRLILLGFSNIIGIILLYLYIKLINPNLNIYYYLIICLVLAKCFTDYFTSYFLARSNKVISVSQSFMVQVATLLLLFLMDINTVNIIKIQIFAVITSLFFVKFVNKADFKFTKIDKKYFIYCLNFSLWQLMGSIAIYIVSYGDNYIIDQFLTLEDVALYNAGYKIFSALFLASNIIVSFYIPTISAAIETKNKGKIKEIFYKDRSIIMAISVFLHFCLFIFAEPLMHFLYSGKYDNASSIFQVLIISSVLRYWTVFEMLYFNIVGKVKMQQMLNVTQAILKIVLSIVLINIFGLIGLAWSTLLSNLITGYISFHYSEKNIIALYK